MLPRVSELGDLQLAVLNVLWNVAPATVYEVQEALSEERKPAYTTILTVLRNLEKRGVVTHDQAEGARMFRYRPLVTLHDLRRSLMGDIAARLFDGSPAALICCLLESEAFTAGELCAIHEVLAVREHSPTGKNGA